MPVRLHPLFRDEPPNRLVGVGRDESAIRKLRAQYAIARAHGDRLPETFYERLLSRYPDLRRLFQGDPAAQRKKLMDSLDVVMLFLDRPTEQAAYLSDLGRRHAGYGAKPEHYPIVAALLAEAMVTTLGEHADPHAYADWHEAFRLISESMLRHG